MVLLPRHDDRWTAISDRFDGLAVWMNDCHLAIQNAFALACRRFPSGDDDPSLIGQELRLDVAADRHPAAGRSLIDEPIVLPVGEKVLRVGLGHNDLHPGANSLDKLASVA